MLEEALYVVARHKNHSNIILIDDFIDKLLASKKFDVLAEKIAQKAVEKVMNLKPNLRIGKDLPAHVNEAITQQIAVKNVSYKTDVQLEETASPLKNLSLKFKYFTKGAYYILDSNDNKGVTDAKDISEPDTTDKNTKLRNDIEVEEDEDSISLSDLDSSLQDKVDKTNHSLKYSKDQKHSKEMQSQLTDKNEEEIENDGSLSIENKRNEEILSENELAEEHKNNESHVDGANSDFDDNVRKDRTLFSNDSKDASKEPNINRNKKPIKKRIHREGNRLYTFQSSSDYDEYHQELERVEKQRNVFV